MMMSGIGPKSMLNEAELNTAVWLKMKKHLEKRLDDLRKKNDSDMSEAKTYKVRGRIAEIKELLNEAEPKKFQTSRLDQEDSLELKLNERRHR